MRTGKGARARDPRPGMWESDGRQIPVGRPMVRGGLLLYYRQSALWHRHLTTDMDHVEAFRKYSRFGIQELNTDVPFPRGIAKLDFELIVVHYTIPGTGFYHLTEDHLEWLKSSRGYKVLLNQDEDRFCGHRFWFCDEVGFDAVDTMLEPSEFGKVYGAHTSVTTLRNSLPGYVSEQLANAGRRLSVPDRERPIDIGYRGRKVPLLMGRGGQEKYEIGSSFLELTAGSNLVLDIGLSEEDYLYGENWARFLASCRGVLGVESGVSVFDVNDRVMNQYENLVDRGVPITAESLTEAEALEGEIFYRTISPRHFEAAALRACQILFEGRYSGVLEPMVHYIPLRKDFSNFDEVMNLFKDSAVRRELADNAHRDLIASGRYSYERFVQQFDADLISAGLVPDPPPSDTALLTRALTRGRFWRAVRVQLGWIARTPILSRIQIRLARMLRIVIPAKRRLPR